ncbi:MAG: formylglycine-generating enzyme family protein [Deltaproteobacteria bacterium]|nr:formylglycine-generating enzyme family protein [Deltaproteobacteria bacterium]
MKKFAVTALIALGLSVLLFFYFSTDNRKPKTEPIKEMEASRLETELRPEISSNFEQETLTNSLGMKFVKIPAGNFMMGSGLSPAEIEKQYGGKKEWYEDDLPQHRVTITRPFHVQTTEVTVGQWRSFIEDSHYKTEAEAEGGATILAGNKFEMKEGFYWDNPGFEQTEKSPVTCISWNDTNAFIKWLNRKEGKEYRLPTEAEWEYVCRAGSTGRFFFGNDQNKLGKYAWYWNNSKKHSHEVGVKLPNAWGLYDVLGNVWEWCQDWYAKYPPNEVIDPTGPSSGSEKVFRGGSIHSHARFCRSAYRGGYQPDGRFTSLGFRLVMIQ